jgi:hypothetical protein
MLRSTALALRARALLAFLALTTCSTLCIASLASAGPFDDPGYTLEEMIAWATDVDELVRGPMDISNPGAGLTSHGSEDDVIGPRSGDTLVTVSLGDGGWITMYFAGGIANAPGDDFAVFENSIWSPEGLFAEFAFVEVSTNGFDFARFEPTSLQPVPVLPFGTMDPSDYENFAGDQEVGLGTGFDLAELAGHPLVTSGTLELGAVFYVRLIDVIGDGTTFDKDGEPVYDPHPTPFPTGGFDLDGIGVLNEPVPEPGQLALLVSGIALLAGLGRRSCAAR